MPAAEEGGPAGEDAVLVLLCLLVEGKMLVVVVGHGELEASSQPARVGATERSGARFHPWALPEHAPTAWLTGYSFFDSRLAMCMSRCMYRDSDSDSNNNKPTPGRDRLGGPGRHEL